MANIFQTIYNIRAYIGTSYDTEWTYAQLGEGFDNVAEALNEIVQQYFYLTAAGFAKNHVTGMAPAWTLSGIRVKGDTAQDYIFSKKYSLGAERASSFKLEVDDENGDTSTLTVACTLCNIQEFSGASTDDAAISVEIRFDEAPTITGGTLLPELVLVSVAGTSSGYTQLYVNPALGSGHTYEYKTGASVAMPLYGADPGATWTAWNGTDELAATTGNIIAVVEVDGSGLAVKGNQATVTSMA